MNIFILDNDPQTAARYLVDKHVVKMIVESCQLMSTAITFHGGIGHYKSTHVNHPCSIWSRKTRSNFEWLYNHAVSIGKEYTFRYGKIHKCEREVLDKLWVMNKVIPNGPITEFAQCIPDQFKSKDPVLAYRVAYKATKSHIANWKNREVPYWWG